MNGEYRELGSNLTMIGMILLIVFSSCSAPLYKTNLRQGSEPPGQRYQITEKDLAQFVDSLRPRRQDPDSLYRQANYLQRSGKHQLALQLLEEAILANPRFYKAYNAMGVSYDHLGDYPRAIEAYKRALKLNPDLAYVQNNLGYSYLRQGNVDAAIDAFKAALALDFQKPMYHNNLALAYAQKGLYDLALAEFKAGGSDAKAHYNLAQIYKRADHNGKAPIHLSASSKTDPAGPSSGMNPSGSEKADKITNNQLEPPAYRISESTPVWMDSNQTDKNNPHPLTPYPGNDKNFQIAYGSYRAVADRPKNDAQIHLPGRKGLEAVEVEIANGNGIDRMAARVGVYLKKNGLNVSRLTNAAHFNFPTTKIFYDDDYLQEASIVAMHIPGYQDMEKVAQFNPRNIKVKVLIGRDLIPFDQIFSQ